MSGRCVPAWAAASTTPGVNTSRPYVGAYREYEFDGKINGWLIDEPPLQGSTGVGEWGFAVKPVADGGMSIDLGVQGCTGVREGVTGSLGMKYEFSSAHTSRCNGSLLPSGRGSLAFLSPRRNLAKEVMQSAHSLCFFWIYRPA